MGELLRDKVCLITGTGKGIGLATLKKFVSEGAIVYANDKTENSLEPVIKELKDTQRRNVIPLYFDITDTTAAKSAIIRIKKEQGRLDALVNNAGIMKDALIGMISRNMMEEVFKVNVYATMELLQFATKLMIPQKKGSITNFASIVGVNGNRGQLVYSASKGAVIALTKTASKELAPYHIRVNALAPGMIDTDMFHSIGENHEKERIEKIGMGRLGSPEEVANLCLFLASDLSEYITGQIIGIDGSALV